METKIKSYLLALLLTNYVLLGGVLLNPQTVFAAGDPPANAATNAAGQNNDPLNPTFQESPIKYQGAEASIRQFLCVPGSGGSLGETTTVKKGTTMATSSPDAQDLSNCVNRLYRFGAAIGSFAAVFFIALAGYFYIVGGESGKQRAKTMIISVIAGLVIIFTSFIFLKQINPSLTEFRTIQPPFLAGVPGVYPSCAEVKLGESCLLPNGSAGVGDGSGGYIGGDVTGKGGKVCSAGKDSGKKAQCSGIPQRLLTAVDEAARQYGIDPNFIKASIQAESDWRENAVGPPTASGTAHGIIQMLPTTAAQMNCPGDWMTNGVTEIPCGVRYFKLIRDSKSIHSTGFVKMAAGYNAGPGRLNQTSHECPGKEKWECPFADTAQTACSKSFEETRNYVVLVLRLQADFSRCK